MFLWPCGMVVIAAVLFQSTKPELKFCAGSNSAHAVSKIRESEVLWQWSWLEIRLNVFDWSTIPQNQFIIIIITTYDLKAINAIYSLILFYMSFVFHSYVLEFHWYVICMSLVRAHIPSVCHSYAIRLWLACTCMSSVCHLYVHVCYPHVTCLF